MESQHDDGNDFRTGRAVRSQSRGSKSPWDSRLIARLSRQEDETCPRRSKGRSYCFPLRSVPQLDLAPAAFPRPPSTTVSLAPTHRSFLGSDPAKLALPGLPRGCSLSGLPLRSLPQQPTGRPTLRSPTPHLYVRGLRTPPYERLVAQLSLSYNCNSPGSSVHGIFQAKILEWAAFYSSRGSSQPRD